MEQINNNPLIGTRAFGFRDFRPLECTMYDNSDCERLSNRIRDGRLEQVSDVENLFDQIFSLDPDTRLPKGDVLCYMNENTSPQVRQFIQTQLMSDMSSMAENKSFDGLSDDDIVAYSRNHGESISDYRSRIVDFVKSLNKKEDE